MTRRFESNLYQFVELDETRRSLKEFVPIHCPSRVMIILLGLLQRSKQTIEPAYLGPA